MLSNASGFCGYLLLLASYLSPPRKLPQHQSNLLKSKSKLTSDDHVDWREKGVIGPIRDQKQVRLFQKQ